MAEEGKYTDTFYAGADYGFEPTGSEYSVGMDSSSFTVAGDFAYPSDPRTSNQLDAVSKRLNTGASTIEVSGVQTAQLENLPQQHLDEINRLRKLTGVDLTFHGPTNIEPTGVTTQGWNDSHREQAERQMWSAVERAHKMDPDGNINVTFHSSSSFPDPITKVKTEVVDPKTGEVKMKEQIKGFWVVDKNSGRFEPLTPKPDYFKGKEDLWAGGDIKAQEKALKDVIEEQNKTSWFKQLQGASFHANQGASIVNSVVLGRDLSPDEKEEVGNVDLPGLYESYLTGSSEMDVLQSLPNDKSREITKKQLHELSHGDIYLRDAYQDLQSLFNQAYGVALQNNAKDDIKKLDSFRKEMKSGVGDIENPSKTSEFAHLITKGIDILRAVNPPQTLKPLRDFGVDQSSETFSNLALNAYKKFGDTAPIISVENPPAGMGLSSADDLRDIIKASRNKLAKKLVKKERLSEWEAKKQAEKLIGVTWDVGHINMIRKYGYGEKELVEETKKIAPYVNKIHLSDNFGLEHTELPMGMGNVPTKPMLEAIQKYNKKIKKVIETGTWFGPQAFGNNTPFKESLRAFGSPIYSAQMGPHWNQVSDTYGSYFSGQGMTLPDHHFSMYGSGFSNLPPELGGQMAGRSRASGAPIE